MPLGGSVVVILRLYEGGDMCARCSSRDLECVTIELFDALHLFVRQRCKFARSRTLRKCAIILLKELLQKFDPVGRHIDDFLDFLGEAIKRFEKGHFRRKVFHDRLFDAGVEEFRMRGCIEIAIKCSSVVQHLDIALCRPLPFDFRQQWPRVGFEYNTVIIKASEDRSADGGKRVRGDYSSRLRVRDG